MFDFDLALKQVPIRARRAEGGDPIYYILKELDGAGRDSYLNKNDARIKNDRLVNFDDYQADLLALCLHNAHEVAGNQPGAVLYAADAVEIWLVGDGLVPVSVIRGLPASMQAALYPKAQELSGLGVKKETKEDAKKD